MEFERARLFADHFEFTSQTGSTNQDLAEKAMELPHFSVLTTDFQAAGRGRLERSWEAAPGSSIMASILLHPNSVSESLGWLSLILAESIRETLAEQVKDVSVKWPNDVLIGQKKVAGILAQFLPLNNSVVLGFGLNVTQSLNELPTDSAISLSLAGATELDRDLLLAEILKRFRGDYQTFASHGFDINNSGLFARIVQGSGTLNKEVRVIYPDLSERTGHATKLDSFGQLVVRTGEGEITVSAADIQHLRIA